MSIRGEYWWLRLHAQGVDWAHCFSGEPVPRQEGSADSLTEVPAPAGARLVLCVPGERARMHRVRLPSANRRRVLAALPFALEDQLLHDVDSYHLVPLPPDKGANDIPVVVIEHAWLSALLEQCRQSGWQAAMLVPDYLAIPEPEQGCWLIDASTSPLLLRKPGNQGAVLVVGVDQQLPGALLLALEQDEGVPRKVRVRVASHQQYQSVTRWSDPLASRAIELEPVMEEHARSAWLVRQPLPDSRLSLLTGPYTVKQPQWVETKQMLLPLALAGALLLVGVLHWVIQGIRLQTEYDQLQQAIEASYRQAFPDTRNLVDPRFQMEQQLASLRSRGTGNVVEKDFLGRLDALAALLATEPDCQLLQIGFDGSMIMLEISVADYEALERLQMRLAQSLLINMESAELKDGRVQGRIRIGGRA